MRRPATIPALLILLSIAGRAYAQDETRGRLNAAARVDLTRADPGGYAGQQPDDPNRGRTGLAATLMLETEHVPLGHGWDASLDFDAGYQPLLVMVKAPDWSAVRPAFIDGLLTTVGSRIGHATATAETMIVGRVGASRVSTTSTVIGSDAAAVRASLAANDIAEWAFFFDGGVEFTWFARSVADVHRARQALDPMVRLYGGFRHDQRYHRDGDLAGFKDPTGRIFYLAEIFPVRLASPTRSGTPSTLLSFGGGFGFETALRTRQRLPSGYRAYVSARLNLAR
jgi:hypothetical protein